MANTIAHLAVAQKILAERPDLVKNRDSFYWGTIAPDAIESKEGAVRDDKKFVHLRLGISDMEWLEPDKMCIFDERALQFIEEHIHNEPDSEQRDFNTGYLVHLLTDKVNHGTMRQYILRALMPRGYTDGTWDFIYEVLNELNALDGYLLKSRPVIAELFYTLMEQPAKYCLPGMIEKEYLEKSQGWWKNEYIPLTGRCSLRIMENRDIDLFIEQAADFIVKELDKTI